MKHPIAVAFGIALVATIVGSLAITSNLRAEETPWALALMWVAFPFLWFFIWLITNAIAWWKQMKGEMSEEPPPNRR